MDVHQVRTHLQREDRNGQREADPEASRHIAQLGAVAGLGRGHHGLERHATDGAVSRAHLPHLRVHGAGVLDVLGVRLWRNLRRGLRVAGERAMVMRTVMRHVLVHLGRVKLRRGVGRHWHVLSKMIRLQSSPSHDGNVKSAWVRLPQAMEEQTGAEQQQGIPLQKQRRKQSQPCP